MEAKLKQMVGLRAFISTGMVTPDDPSRAEYRTLLDEAAKHYLPLVTLMAQSGLLHIGIVPDEGDTNIDKGLVYVVYDVAKVFPKGGIVVVGHDCTESMPASEAMTRTKLRERD